MTLDAATRPQVDEVLGGLKDFQRDTVDYVFNRLYVDDDSVSRFLIADEVGLGKTLVARGLIAKAVDHLWDTVDRIDVLYICSNQEIARQNIDRLNITKNRKFQLASRATLLPVTLQQLKGNKLNFVSFTPGTSFQLHSTSGVAMERWILYRLLVDHWNLHEPTCRNILRAGVKKGNFKKYIASYEQVHTIEPELANAFSKQLDSHQGLRETYDSLVESIGYRRKHIPQDARMQRDIWIGELRRLLAQSSLKALEPDIVILDEFQRFRNLLDEEDPISLLANEVFKFKDVKVLMLSATPYKMYSLAWEREDDHYEDFYRTIKFLLEGDEDELAALEDGVASFRDAYLRIENGQEDSLQRAKKKIEGVLRRVVARTERLAASEDRNGMLSENHVGQGMVRARDFVAFNRIDAIANHLESGDQVEYWKSSAYPLNLMENYKIKQQLERSLKSDDENGLTPLLKKAEKHLLRWTDIQAYKRIDPQNARLRALFNESIDTGNWKLLWMPPSMPYYRPGRSFRDVKEAGQTKSLVFSAWQVVPKVVAVLASYEAERRMLQRDTSNFRYNELTEKRRPLLNFTRTGGRLTGMPVFCLTYPSWTLATQVDPFEISKSIGKSTTPSMTAVYKRAREMVRSLLDDATRDWPVAEGSRVDDQWYWASLAIMDWRSHRDLLESWFDEADVDLRWEHMVEDHTEGDRETAFSEHVEEFQTFLRNREPLGKRPRDLVDVLTRVALAGPATSTMRAILRVSNIEGAGDRLAVMSSSAKAGLGFRTLFNQPQAISLISSIAKSGAYWTKVLRYAHQGNLQAVLDEYMHVLHESLGLVGHEGGETAIKLGETLTKAASLRSPSLAFDEIVRNSEGGYELKQRRIRCRYALRLGDEKSEGMKQWTRSADVRVAFNSPFRPFILATTSIGQEGLDFHQYCHRVVHWNLPSNPVDLEQREGRVHRYKGHVIRRNISKEYGMAGMEGGEGELDDPWDLLFARAVEDVGSGSAGIRPYWIFEVENGYKIERCIPMLPMSREIGQLEWLKKTLVAYRSVIGQPRQQELVDFLAQHLSEEEMERFSQSVSIDLSPPKRASA